LFAPAALLNVTLPAQHVQCCATLARKRVFWRGMGNAVQPSRAARVLARHGQCCATLARSACPGAAWAMPRNPRAQRVPWRGMGNAAQPSRTARSMM